MSKRLDRGVPSGDDELQRLILGPHADRFNDPEFRTTLKKGVTEKTLQIEKLKHLPELFRIIAYPVNPQATVLFLGTGPRGEELICARQVFTEGKILGIDKKHDPLVLLAEIAADAQFTQMDLDEVSPQEACAKIGASPDIVISRHPLFSDKWTRRIPQWGEYMQELGGIFAVTTATLNGQVRTGSAMVQAGLQPTFRRFEGGLIVDPERPEHKRDQYVTLIKPRLSEAK